jgi:hypothetical protein
MWSPWWLRHVVAVERDSHNRTMQELREAEAAQPRGAVEALERIRELGRVCDEYDTCEHRACRDSYAAWAIAAAYLGRL